MARSRQRRVRLNLGKAKRLAEKILTELGCRDKELSLLFVDDKGIEELNRRYLKREGPTDVLAFPLGDPLLGDLVISVERAYLQARERGHPLEEELALLLIHGTLHLLGYDHTRSRKEAGRMARKERELLKMVKGSLGGLVIP